MPVARVVAEDIRAMQSAFNLSVAVYQRIQATLLQPPYCLLQALQRAQ